MYRQPPGGGISRLRRRCGRFIGHDESDASVENALVRLVGDLGSHGGELRAMERHRPQYLDCHVTLFRTATDDKFEIPGDDGWREMVRSLEIVIVPGDHLTMFDAEHAPGLAREIANRA